MQYRLDISQPLVSLQSQNAACMHGIANEFVVKSGRDTLLAFTAPKLTISTVMTVVSSSSSFSSSEGGSEEENKDEVHDEIKEN